jgi:putative ATP-dependent endonuclease of the OLD family
MNAPSPSPPVHTGIRVDAVRIARFRSLRNIEVNLKERTLLVGMNNTGKTSFLKALHVALGVDRRLISTDDFALDASGMAAKDILIDVRIVPVDSNGMRIKSFDQKWVDADLGGPVIKADSEDREYVAIRTRISPDVVKNDISIDTRLLNEWPEFSKWQEATATVRVRRFEQLVSFFIDAQRDVVGDLRARSSYMGRLLSKVELPEDAVTELEERIRMLNEDIVGKSQVLSHVRDVLGGLNRTVPAFGEGVEISPVSKKMRELVQGVGVRFSDGAGASFPLESHGMGTRSWASLLSFEAYVSWTSKLAHSLSLPFHPVLFLEEPEAHLHPNAQRSVYGQLARGIGQRVVTTHSPYIAGQADLDSIVHFSKDRTGTVIRTLPTSHLSVDDVRKIRREVLRSRGELLFARAVVLFEGETEEQALPLFAQHYWGCHPFEHGVVFVGAGSDGNYAPFLRTFEAIGISWFILSDGEPNARTRVTDALKKAGLEAPNANVFTLPNNRDIEGYLFDEGYQNEVRAALVEMHRPFHSGQHEQSKVREIQTWTDARMLDYLKANKTRTAPHWAEAITRAGGNRSIPSAVRDLLQRIDTILGGETNPKPT